MGGREVKTLIQPANFILGPDVTLNTEIHDISFRIKASNLVKLSTKKKKEKARRNHRQNNAHTSYTKPTTV